MSLYISQNHLRHISTKHGIELEKIGLSSMGLVKFIFDNFNQIRKGSGESYLLVVYDDKLSNVAAIQLNYSLKKSFGKLKQLLL